MKVFISVDMEGITGVATWSHVMRKQPEYQEARERHDCGHQCSHRGSPGGRR